MYVSSTNCFNLYFTLFVAQNSDDSQETNARQVDEYIFTLTYNILILALLSA